MKEREKGDRGREGKLSNEDSFGQKESKFDR